MMTSKATPGMSAALRHKAATLGATTALFALLSALVIAFIPSRTAADTSTPTSVSWLPVTPPDWPVVTKETTGSSEAITNGITYATDTLESTSGKQQGHVMNVDLSNPDISAGVVEAGNKIVDDDDETIGSMADRSGAVAGINGDFFEIAGQGDPVGMVVQDGKLLKSPNPGGALSDFLLLNDGTAVVTTETFSGTVTDVTDGMSDPLNAVNTFDAPLSNSITLDTSDEGAVTVPSARVAVGHLNADGTELVISEVDQGVTQLPALSAGEEDVVGIGTTAAWVASNIHAGDSVSISDSLSPYPLSQIKNAISGGAILEQSGQMAVPVTGTGENNEDNPVTGVGVAADGKHLVIAVFDGHQSEGSAEGLTRPELAQWMIEHGAENAILFDSGGSSEMVGRLPGETTPSVLNTPSDGQERPVANGLFFYSTESSAGPATEVHVNGGSALSTAAGVASEVPAYADDAAGNPAGDAVKVTAEPASLGTWSDGVFTAGSAGTGALVIQAGSVSTQVPLTVTQNFDSLSISPSEGDIEAGGTEQYAVTGTNSSGSAVTINPSSVQWRLSRSDIGSIDSSTGLFTATSGVSGVVDVVATVGNKSVTAVLGVGEVTDTVVTTDDASQWATTLHNSTTVPSSGFSDLADVPPDSTQKQSISLQYSFPNTTAVHQVVFYPKGDVATVGPNSAGQEPTSVTFRMKITDAAPDNLSFYYAYIDGNGSARDVNAPVTTFNQWIYYTMDIPSGTTFPLTLNYLDLLNTKATAADSGTLTFAGMSVSYAARTPDATAYQAIDPNNPAWLSYEENSSDFSSNSGGTTFLFGDDAHLLANDPGSTSATNIEDMAKRVAGESYATSAGQTVDPLPTSARPNTVVSLGDIADDGVTVDLQFAKTEWDTFGLPFYDVVGNHEISQGGVAENADGGFYGVFQQNTHFSSVEGPVTFIALDNSHGSIASSDADQAPAEEQFPWFVDQLNAANTPVVFVGIHMPAYDPAPTKDSQFTDRWEADQFLQVIQDYQQSHPDKHVVVFYGHSRGFSDQFLDPAGDEGTASTGIPQLTCGDVGMPAYKDADEGGFYHFCLVHVTADGKVQFTVEPMLKSLTIDQGTSAASEKVDTLVAGQQKQYTATAVNENGDNITDPPSTPIADPMSHVWASSDTKVATVSANGRVIAVGAGTTTISVASGGITAKLIETVSRQPTTSTLQMPRRGTAGRKEQLTALVSPAEPGAMTFKEGGSRTLKTVVVSNGRASISVKLPAGRHTVTASFAPADADVDAASTASNTMSIAKAKARISVKAPRTVVAGHAAKITVKVTATGLTPSGRVTVKLDGRKVSGKLQRGRRTLRLKNLKKVGRRERIIVSYAGSSQIAKASDKKARLTVKRRH
jgi:exopolysaccharide biosynthesis protein